MGLSPDSRDALAHARVLTTWRGAAPECLQGCRGDAETAERHGQKVPGLKASAHPYVVVVVDPPHDPVYARLVMRTSRTGWRERGIPDERAPEVPGIGSKAGTSAYLPFEDVPFPPVPVRVLQTEFARKRGYDVPCKLRGRIQAAIDRSPSTWVPVRRLWHRGGCPPCED